MQIEGLCSGIRHSKKNFCERFDAELTTGMREEDYMGVEILERFADLRIYFLKSLSEGPQHSQYLFEDNNGTDRYYDITWWPIKMDAKTTLVAVFNREITEQKNVQIALEKSEENINQ